MRVLTISSAKGGVGKTSFAINFALNLSQHGKTLLIDLDTSTSSVRNSMDMPVQRDLYHFFRKGFRLDQCVTTLDRRIDPDNRFPNFGFVAGPMHIIEEITNLDKGRRHKLIDAINALDARYVVLDLKAGMDANVLGFLPYSNTGILVFTPHLPAATMAASDMVKALLFRKLRHIFAPRSPIYREYGMDKSFPEEINDLLNRVEDIYDDEFVNLDAFLVWLQRKLGPSRVVHLIASAVEYFRVYFVLNMFNETSESYEKAIKPFVENIVRNISSRINVCNIGFIIDSPKLHQANCRKIPLLLYDDVLRGKRENRAIREWEKFYLGLVTEKQGKVNVPDSYRKANPARQLNHQLDILQAIHDQTRGVTIEQNFDYIRERVMYLLAGRRTSDFGDTRLFKEGEILQALFQRGQ